MLATHLSFRFYFLRISANFVTSIILPLHSNHFSQGKNWEFCFKHEKMFPVSNVSTVMLPLCNMSIEMFLKQSSKNKKP